jgi:hypothetical protein
MDIIDPTVCSDWNDLIASSPEHTFFHSSNWAGVLKDAYSYKPLYFTMREGPKVSALIPVMEVKSFLTGKRGVSLPFTDYCEPISSDLSGFSSVLAEALQYGKNAGWKYLELRGGTRLLNGAVPYGSYVRHVLALHDQEPDLFRQLNSAARRNIRTAEKSGVRIAVSDFKTDLDEYYRLHCMTRKRHGVPPQPYGFFRAVHRNVISKGKGFTVLGRYGGRPVSGAVFFHCGRKAIYKFGATDLNYQHLRPANLVMWEAIRHFSKNGFDELCFGRTDLENSGLIRFKAGFGAREEIIHYYRYDLRRSAFVQGLPASRFPLLSCLPVPLLRLAGTLFYRHMG